MSWRTCTRPVAAARGDVAVNAEQIQELMPRRSQRHLSDEDHVLRLCRGHLRSESLSWLMKRSRHLTTARPWELVLHDPALQGMPGNAEKLGRLDDAAARLEGLDAKQTLRSLEVEGVENDGWSVHGWCRVARSARPRGRLVCRADWQLDVSLR